MTKSFNRRVVLGGLVVGGVVGSAALAMRNHVAPILGPLDITDALNHTTQRLLLSNQPLAREFSRTDVSLKFPTNGTVLPQGDRYQRFLETGFTDFKLKVDGLVDRPLSLSLDALKALKAHTQITMHCCDEGWSAIGEWTGVPLALLLGLARVNPRAKYVVFHCMDNMAMDHNFYYESLDLFTAHHPQTILAYGLNGGPLPVANGAPLRLRVETQIGYKNAKYVERVEVVDSLRGFGSGRGGWWEDIDRAPWYATS